MITDKIAEAAPGQLNKIFDLKQIYGCLSVEERLKMQRISKYADILVEYIWRNRLFINNMPSELFDYHEQIFLFVSDYIDVSDFDNLIFEKMPLEVMEYIKSISKYKNEFWDGSGSPIGKKGEGIPFVARIYAIARRYEELIRENPYKIKDGNSVILQQINEESGSKFQPELVKTFLNCFSLLQKRDTELGAVII